MPIVHFAFFVVSLIGPCLPQQMCLMIPIELYPRARLKARLADDLIQSVKNDADHILDIKLEEEIASLEIQLLKGKEQ